MVNDAVAFAWAACLAAVGLCVGSFLALAADRLPEGEPVVAGRSRCSSCRRTLKATELVPLLSFAALGGRCQSCRAPIPLHLPAIEAAGGAVGLAAGLVAPGEWALVTAALGWSLLLAAALDARAYWLPVSLTLGIAGAGLLVSALTGRLPEAALGAAAGFAVLEVVRVTYHWRTGRSGLGGGDPLLLGALGAWVGAAGLPPVLLAASLMALAYAAATSWLRGQRLSGNARVPLGAWLAAAGFMVWCVGGPG